MVDVTDSCYRYFMRMLTKHSFLYTEMITYGAILYSEEAIQRQLLDFTENQHPIVFQIGGNDPEKVAEAAKLVEKWGYDEINLNCGCPSNRCANQGCFGARLMFDPELVARMC